MGVLDRLGLTRGRFDRLASPVDLGIASPWQEGNLTSVVLPDIFGVDFADKYPLSRSEAMTIPGVVKARNLLVSTISRLPLVALSAGTDQPVDPQPTFLYRTNGPESPEDRLAGTVDDLIFYGRALWLVERGAGDSPTYGPILNAAWLPQNRWTITNGVVLVDELPIAESDYLLFVVPLYAGLLALGSRTIRGARSVEEAWVARAKNPIPLLALQLNDDVELEQDEIDAVAASWTVRHNSSSPSVGVVPKGITPVALGQQQTDLLESARNAMRGDIGAFVNVNAAMLDGTSGVNSLTYSTKDGERSIFYTESLPFWLTPIYSRLSMDDVVPRGQRVRFDTSEFVNAPTATGTPTED